VSGGAAGHEADVTVRAREMTRHVVSISRDELARYGGGDVADLVRRSFEFLLEREPNTSILRRFALSDIERYFPEYPSVIRSR
jgi:hypothetical protein